MTELCRYMSVGQLKIRLQDYSVCKISRFGLT